jgi:Glucodextranase, domain B
MTTRRDSRQAHVRPRPPSSGRPAPVKAKPRSPGPTRLSTHRPIRRSRGLPVVLRIGLVAAVVALGIAVLAVAAGGLSFVVGGVGSTVGGFIDGVTSTPSPTAAAVSISDPPTLEQPAEPYTDERTVDLVVTVPAGLAGDTTHRIKVFLALPDQNPAAIQETPIADGPRTIIPVELEDGINDFTVSIVGPGGESESSLPVRFVYDATPPKITITTPKNNATVNRQAVQIKGKTQARTTLLARNEANGSSIASTAGPDGTFELSLAITSGINTITIVGTDPAGNVNEVSLNVKRGNGKLTVALTASDYQLRRGQLPEAVTLVANVIDPDGRPLPGANVTFTLSMPGIPTVTIDTTTNANGRATFRTTVPKSADLGQGSAAVLVSSNDYGSTEDFTVISIVK